MKKSPLVSNIIRTLNEGKYLEPLLTEIRRQDYSPYEIVVVDSGSFDSTLSIAEKYADKIIKIKQEDFTFGYAINHGIKNSSGELICILSAHTRPTGNNWMSSMVSGFSAENPGCEIAMVYGRQVGLDVSNYSEKKDFSRQFGLVFIEQRKPNYFCNNANSMIRKDLWEKHPFDESLSGLEDIEWSKYWMDQGYQIIYQPKAEIYHIHTESPSQIRRRFWREAVAARSIGVLPIYKIVKDYLLQYFLLAFEVFQILLKSEHKRALLNESSVYRHNKAIGIFKSLFDTPDGLKDYSLHYAPLDYKVIEITGKGHARMTDYQVTAPRPTDVMIKVSYVGVCETDFEVYNGELGFYKSGLAKFPIVPGHEFSGEVIRVGAKVKNFVPGDRVVGQCILTCGKCESCLGGRELACKDRREVGVLNYNGAYGEYITLSSRFCHKIPDSLSLVSAASIEPLAVVYKGLRRAGLDDQSKIGHKRIAVIGCGPIGHLAVRICVYWGHDVTAVDSNETRLDVLSDVRGAKVGRVDGYDKYSHIIECTGNPALANDVIEKSSTGSCVLLLGLPYDSSPLNLEQIVSYDKNIIGSVGSHGRDFVAAINMAPELNMEYFNKNIFQFQDWQAAMASHKTKSFLKTKIKL